MSKHRSSLRYLSPEKAPVKGLFCCKIFTKIFVSLNSLRTFVLPKHAIAGPVNATITMITNITALVTELENQGLAAANWKDKRVYINGVGFNTKKTKQKLYIDLASGRTYATTDCPGQDSAWCDSQSAILVENYREKIEAAIAASNPDHVAEAEAKQAKAESTTVQGWYASWEMTYDGPYGRKTGNRPFIRLYSGSLANAPRGFKALTEAEYEVAKTKVGKRIEQGVEPTFTA